METTTPTITVSDVLHLIEDARDAELCRNLAESQRSLESIWPDIGVDPDFSHFPPVINAELLRLAGFFLSFYGKSRNKRDYQLRGKDLLTNAIRIFEGESSHNKAAEAKVMLALCYWYSGEVAECDAILDQVENEFAGNQLHPVYLQIRVNRLMVLYWNQKYDEAIKIIRHLALSMELSHDPRLNTMYHNQAGLVYERTGQIDKAIFHLNEAVQQAKSANNLRFVGLNLNNLAIAYKGIGQFVLAHEYVDKARSVFEDLEDIGWIPHAYDTKALIYLAEGRDECALADVNSALDLFRQGEDFAGFADSLWTKCLCLLKLDRKEEVLTVYAELHQIASKNIGAVTADRYTKALADQFYYTKGLPLPEEVAAFKKTAVCRALTTAGSIGEASKLLGLKNHQALSDILNKQFPEIYDELDIPRRRRRAGAISCPQHPSVMPANDHEIAIVQCPPGLKLAFNKNINPASLQTFFCSENMMSFFGIRCDAIVAVGLGEDIVAGRILLYTRDKKYYFGKLEFEELSRLFFVEGSANTGPLLLDDVQIVGIAVGYCPVHLIDDTTGIHFRPLQS